MVFRLTTWMKEFTMYRHHSHLHFMESLQMRVLLLLSVRRPGCTRKTTLTSALLLVTLFSSNASVAHVQAKQEQAAAQVEEANRLNDRITELYQAGRYDEAIPLAERILAIMEKLAGREHIYVAQSLSNLALLYEVKGDYERAEPLYQRSLAIFEKKLGTDHLNVAQVLTNLAALYVAKGQYARAEPLFQRSLTIREKNLGDEHELVAQS